MKRILLLPIVLCWVAVSFAQDTLSPEKLWELGRVSLDDVSPDGNAVVYGVTYYDVAANKGNRDLYLVPTQGGAARKVTAFPGSENNARFRPDGQRIGFLSGGHLWEMDPDGTNMEQVSDEEMNGFAYSPSGQHILFIRPVKYDTTVQEMYPDLPLANARIIDDLMYRHWDSWEDGKRSNIFVMDYREGELTGEARNIMDQAFDSPLEPFGGMSEICWSPDGNRIVYTMKKLSGRDYAESTNSDLYEYDLRTGRTRNLTEGMPGYDRDPAFSPDGRYLAWNSMERAGFESDRQRIFVLDTQTGEKADYTENFGNDASHPQWSPDGKTIYFTTGINATYQLGALDVNLRRVRRVTEGRHNIYGFHPTTNGIVCERVSMSEPAELWRVNAASGSLDQLTFTNKELLSTIKMGEVQKRMVRTSDGKEMLVWHILPPDFDPNKSYPTLLYCQGGPQSAVSQFFSYRWNFQLMAANGYVVVAPNRRGLPSFGREWNDQISGDWGGQAMQDYFSAIDDARDLDYVDEDRLGAVGASFGGYSVYWLAGNHDDRFKAFISHCGLFNLESWYGTTEELFFANFDIGGPYWNPDLAEDYQKFSPHNFVRNWDVPILVIHGEKDFRVPISEGMQAFQAAQVQGIPSRFLYFPEEGHWVLSPQNGILWHRVFFDWLEKWLK